MRIHTRKSNVSDNLLFVLEEDGDMILVDPYDSAQMIDFVRSRSPARVRILTTHGHPDHVGGNAAVKEALGCEVLASKHGDTFHVESDAQVGDGDVVTIGQTELQIRHAPGHTDGHIVAYTDGHLVSGDVYFVGGAGNCRFGGDPAELHRTYSKRLVDLPDDTTFYPGHDYAEKNFEFCLMVEPDNEQAQERLDELRAQSSSEPTLTTLGEERAYNPFHRTGESDLQRHLKDAYGSEWKAASGSDSERAFRVLRGLRDSF